MSNIIINNMAQRLEGLIQKLRNSNKLLVGTGAGMGKDSGLPDFRGDDGFWNNYPPYRNKFNFQQCANPDFLRSNPHLFWGFYGSRLQMYRRAIPHHGYTLLSKIALFMDSNFNLTSNVDGHLLLNSHQNSIMEVHGSIHHLQCYRCQYIKNNDFQPVIDFSTMSCSNLPICSTCSSHLRPNILMFNDWQWIEDRASRQNRNYKQFLKNITPSDKLAIIQIGCGTAVPTIRSMCERVYYQHKNSIYIRINTDEEQLSRQADNQRYFHLRSSALEAIKMLAQEAFDIV